MPESLQEFLNRKPDLDEVAAMRKANAVEQWDSAHPHGMMIEKGKGPYLEGKVKQKDGTVEPVKVIDAHGQILCNAAGYNNPEVEAARALARERGVDAFSNNFHSPIVEWARAVLLDSLGQWREAYKLLFVTSGTEANDALRRVACAQGGGQAEFINLREGYSGAGYGANAACGNPVWKGKSTPSLPGMHFVSPTRESLMEILGDIPRGHYPAAMFEAGNLGVGGFYTIEDEFLRQMAEEVRKRKGDVYPDEVQTGLGRTGRAFWASQKIFEGLTPPPAGM
ncbi:MAG: aminotransferase class III-fold pyridoxal phosphate-dependent enzyme, partial [Candidatus Peregrinibacteria bacterium]